MAFFNVSCYEDLIYTYNNSQCFKADKVSTDRVEECYIDIYEDGVLYVKDFYVRHQDYLRLNYIDWEGVRVWESVVGPCGVQVYRGERMTFDMGPGVRYYSGWSHFDICLNVEWDEGEEYTLMGGDGATRGENATKGNVYLNGQPICHENWGRDEANIICRKLGFDYGEATINSQFGALDDNNFIFGEVQCGGWESSIWQCDYETERSCYCSLHYGNADRSCECSIYSGAGVECYYETVTVKSNELKPMLVIILPVVAALLCCCLLYCLWSIKKYQSHPKNRTVGHVQKVKNIQMENTRATNNNPNINREYQPNRTNMFKDYHRPEDEVWAYGTNQRATAETNYRPEGQVSGYRTNQRETAQTNYVVPGAYDNGAATDFGPSAPPPYEPPAYY